MLVPSQCCGSASDFYIQKFICFEVNFQQVTMISSDKAATSSHILTAIQHVPGLCLGWDIIYPMVS